MCPAAAHLCSGVSLAVVCVCVFGLTLRFCLRCVSDFDFSFYFFLFNFFFFPIIFSLFSFSSLLRVKISELHTNK